MKNTPPPQIPLLCHFEHTNKASDLLSEPSQGPQPRQNPQFSVHTMCQTALTSSRPYILSHLQHQSIPLSMEGLYHGNSQKTWKAQLYKTGSILTHSAYQHNCQNTFGLCHWRPNWHSWDMPTTTCQPLWMPPRKDHIWFPPLHHEIHKGHMEKGGSHKFPVSQYKGCVAQYHPKPTNPWHENQRNTATIYILDLPESIRQTNIHHIQWT